MSAKVLVVDDSALVRAQVSATLVLRGCSVSEAADGVEALAKLDEVGGVDLVVCDLNMPRLGGLEFLERLRTHPAHASISVVVLTTDDNFDRVVRAKELGAKGWILKPFRMNVFLAVVKGILDKDGSDAFDLPPESARR